MAQVLATAVAGQPVEPLPPVGLVGAGQQDAAVGQEAQVGGEAIQVPFGQAARASSRFQSVEGELKALAVGEGLGAGQQAVALQPGGPGRQGPPRLFQAGQVTAD